MQGGNPAGYGMVNMLEANSVYLVSDYLAQPPGLMQELLFRGGTEVTGI